MLDSTDPAFPVTPRASQPTPVPPAPLEHRHHPAITATESRLVGRRRPRASSGRLRVSGRPRRVVRLDQHRRAPDPRRTFGGPTPSRYRASAPRARRPPRRLHRSRLRHRRRRSPRPHRRRRCPAGCRSRLRAPRTGSDWHRGGLVAVLIVAAVAIIVRTRSAKRRRHNHRKRSGHPAGDASTRFDDTADDGTGSRHDQTA